MLIIFTLIIAGAVSVFWLLSQQKLSEQPVPVRIEDDSRRAER